MAMWDKTGNMLAEKRNSFLKDVARHGFDVVYRVKSTTGGTFDPITETMVGATSGYTDTTHVKAALPMPIKSLDDGETGRTNAKALVVTGGHRIQGFDISLNLTVKLKVAVPLNFEAQYVINNQSYRLSRILANINIGSLPCWNEVLLEKV